MPDPIGPFSNAGHAETVDGFPETVTIDAGSLHLPAPMSPDAEHALADLDAAGTDHAYAHRCTDGQWYRLGHRCPTRQNLLHAETHVRALIGAVEKAAADPDALRTVAEGMTGLMMADLDGDSREGWQATARLAVLSLAAWLSTPPQERTVTT
jgi:hypothetical protein